MFQEMLGELFTPVETPEAPNRGFFKGLFGGGAQSLDREELCKPHTCLWWLYSLLYFCPACSITSCLPSSVGEVAAGRASKSLAQHIPGPGGIEGMKGAASGVVGDLARARIALDERGQKLGELEERTAAMMASADSFSKHAHDVSDGVTLENSQSNDKNGINHLKWHKPFYREKQLLWNTVFPLKIESIPLIFLTDTLYPVDGSIES